MTEAISNIWRRPLRTALTILGIVIGVFALQGNVREHLAMLAAVGVVAGEVAATTFRGTATAGAASQPGTLQRRGGPEFDSSEGFREFIDLGIVDEKPWRISGAQATGCSPIATAFKSGADTIRPVRPDTVAKSLADTAAAYRLATSSVVVGSMWISFNESCRWSPILTIGNQSPQRNQRRVVTPITTAAQVLGTHDCSLVWPEMFGGKLVPCERCPEKKRSSSS